MGICRRKLVLTILTVGNIFPASAQLNSSVLDSNKVETTQPKTLKKLIVPTALLGYGALSLESSNLRQLDRYINNSTIGQYGYSGSVDDYLRYGPIAAVYGLGLIGLKAKHNFIDRSVMLLLSTSMASSAVTVTKNNIDRMRPDGSGISSFPSSHTAIAFMAAEFMNQEYGEKSLWFSVIGYGTATTTGILRLYHHVHWLSDVVMGAGYGILSTKLVYFIYPYLKKMISGKNLAKFTFAPSIRNSLIGFKINYIIH
ncbi:MAG: phosphatase PAP2 family protein [Pedobacter sp.]|nr:phosphatase PAP2 family protein [Pedobacter sp.]